MSRALLVVALLFVFAWLFGLRLGGGWYSGDFAYRLQTDAFLRGSLALQPLPYNQRFDWAWGAGNQQVWGLGMPLLRLPFEAVVRLFGGFGFPDSLVFLLYFAGVTVLLGRLFRDRPLWEWLALLSMTAFFPAFINLCRTRFEVYEEAVGGAYLLALILGALVLWIFERPRPRLMLLLGALAGIGPIVRPTVIFYSGPAMALGLYASRKLPRRTLLCASLLFVAGIGVILALNQARFRHPLEFGHRLNVSYNAYDQYAKNFGYLYQKERPGRAAAELFSALFLSERANGFDFYVKDVLPLQSPTPRFRELYFATFRPWMAAALLMSWLAVLLLRRRIRDRRVIAAALLSFLSFVGQTGFYLRAPSLTSRYVMDFGAAISFGLVALLLLGFTLTRRPLASVAISVGTAALVVFAVAGAWIGEVQSHHKLLTVDEARAQMPVPSFFGPTIPDRYHCDQPPDALTGIPLNGLGWNTGRGCLVHVLTQIFMPTHDCLTLRVAPLEHEKVLLPVRTREMRLRRGLWEMVKVRDTLVGTDRLVTFCAPENAPTNPTGIELYFIGWTSVSNLPGLAHRLMEVYGEPRTLRPPTLRK